MLLLLNGGKQGFLVLVLSATRAFLRDRRSDIGPFEVFGADLMRRAGHNLLGVEQAGFDDTAYLVIGDTELCSGLRHGEPFTVSVAGCAIALDLMDVAQRADTMPSPCLALTRSHTHAIECSGDIGIGPTRRH